MTHDRLQNLAVDWRELSWVRCLVFQGFWPDGVYTAATDDALAADIKLAKGMGFNTIRKHLKVQANPCYPNVL